MKHLLFLLLMPVFVFGQNFVLIENVEYLDDLDAVVVTKRFQDSTWRDTTVDSGVRDSIYPDGTLSKDLEKKGFHANSDFSHPDEYSWNCGKYGLPYAKGTISYHPEGYTCFVPGCKRHGNPEIKGDPNGKLTIKGSGGIEVHEADNGMIRIKRKESDTEFWRRKYVDLLRNFLEVIEKE